jgi:hypothetical protein
MNMETGDRAAAAGGILTGVSLVPAPTDRRGGAHGLPIWPALLRDPLEAYCNALK